MRVLACEDNALASLGSSFSLAIKTLMTKNRLHIKASTLALEFSGEADEIRQGYETTRELIISCFQEQLQNIQAHESSLAEDSELHQRTGRTKSLHGVTAPSKEWTPPDASILSHVSLALHSDLYVKICVLDRGEFEASILNNMLHFDQINRIYIPHNQKQNFSAHFSIGKVLWRELTSKGRKAVRSSDST